MNIQLSGGGLDSTALFFYLIEHKINFQVLHFDYGQKAFLGERASVNYFCKKYQIKRLKNDSFFDFSQTKNVLLFNTPPTVGNSPESISKNKLECRNLVLISMTCSLVASMGGGQVYIGYHKEPENAPFPDATKEFFLKFKELLPYSSYEKVELIAPFQEQDFTRYQIFEYGLKKDPEFMQKTFTCYESTNHNKCGLCAHCLLEKDMSK